MSLLVYLDAAWPRDWGAETLFLDGRTDVGVAVRRPMGQLSLLAVQLGAEALFLDGRTDIGVTVRRRWASFHCWLCSWAQRRWSQTTPVSA